IFVVISLCNTASVVAQIYSDAQNGYITVRSYNGSTTPNAFGYRVHMSSTPIVSDWSMMIRVNGQIRNSEGKIVDPSKIRIRINNISGDQPPTLAQIGGDDTPIPLSLTEVTIFRNSKAALQGPHKQTFFSFDILVDGGIYLEALKSWQEYNLNVVFSLRNRQNQVITSFPASVRMQIYPQGAPPTGPTYSIQINGTANDALLDFNSVAHYAEGVSKTYNNGLSITSSTNYAVQVRTLTPTFQATSSTVPVGTVRLNLKQANGNKEQTITLSPEP